MDNLPEISKDNKLTKKEEALIEVLRRPETSSLPVTHICEKAGIDTSTYYRAFKKEHFVRQVHDECVGLVQASVVPILHTARAQAVLGEKNSHHWAKMLLEMSGLYVPRKEAQVKAEVKLIFNVPRPGTEEGQIIDIKPESE